MNIFNIIARGQIIRFWFEGNKPCLIFLKVDSCVYQAHLGHSCYHQVHGPVETSFSIGNSSQLSWNFRHKIQLGWVEFLLKMMFQLVPVSRGNRPRKTITSCKLEKRRWLIGMMDSNHDSERLRGFDNRKMDRRSDICNSRVAFLTENSHKKTRINIQWSVKQQVKLL